MEHPPHILIVDDEPQVARALERLLRRHGWRVTIALSGARGLELLEAERPLAVVSDFRMPGMDGALFLERVAARHPGVRRVLISGYTEPGAAAPATAEVDAFLPKPWDDEELLATLRRLVGGPP